MEHFVRLAVICVLSLGVPASAVAADLDLDGLVARHLDAIGGAEKLAAVRSLKITGNMVLGGGQLEAPVTLWVKRPNRTRTEVLVGGKSIVQAFDGKTGWTINPMSGTSNPQLMPMDQIAGLVENSDVIEGPFTSYKEKGNTAELAGVVDLEGERAYQVKLTRKNGREMTIFLDAKSFLPVKVIQSSLQLGQQVENETVLSDYRAVAGVMMPYSQEVRASGRQVMRRTIRLIEVNTSFPDQLFAMPAMEPPVPPTVRIPGKAN